MFFMSILYEKKKTFREIMDEYDSAYGDLEKKKYLLSRAAKLAKTNSEKFELTIQYNTLKEKLNR